MAPESEQERRWTEYSVEHLKIRMVWLDAWSHAVPFLRAMLTVPRGPDVRVDATGINVDRNGRGDAASGVARVVWSRDIRRQARDS